VAAAEVVPVREAVPAQGVHPVAPVLIPAAAVLRPAEGPLAEEPLVEVLVPLVQLHHDHMAEVLAMPVDRRLVIALVSGHQLVSHHIS
jgi:hypothetical protein